MEYVHYVQLMAVPHVVSQVLNVLNASHHSLSIVKEMHVFVLKAQHSLTIPVCNVKYRIVCNAATPSKTHVISAKLISSYIQLTIKKISLLITKPMISLCQLLNALVKLLSSSIQVEIASALSVWLLELMVVASSVEYNIVMLAAVLLYVFSAVYLK